MFCPGCGEEIYLIDNFKDVNYLYCEECEQLHTVRQYGPVPKRLESMQKSYFQKEIRNSRPVKISKRESNIKMSNPADMINEAVGKFKAVAF